MVGKKKKKKSAAGGLIDILATIAVDGSGEKLNSSHNIKARTHARMHARTNARTNAQTKPNQTRISILTAYIDRQTGCTHGHQHTEPCGALTKN